MRRDHTPFPEFPWEPPVASTKEEIPFDYFSTTKTLKDYSNKISNVLDRCGYTFNSFYYVPHGFAIATQLERIKDDGTYVLGPDRWNNEYSQLSEFSLKAYIKALFTANPGYYRCLVFVVTDIPFSFKPKPPSEKEVREWAWNGLNRLPPEYGSQPTNKNYVCSVLVYEFEKFEDGTVKQRIPSSLSGRGHLVANGFYKNICE